MNLWLYIHFPRLQLDTLFSEAIAPAKNHADGSENPAICIVEKHQITQANQAAIEKGITLGMGLGSAASLCADLQVFPYQQKIEEDKLQQIAQWLYVYTSDITLYTHQGLLLKVSNMLTLYRDLESYWRVISQHLDQLHLHYSYATAYSPLGAKLLAETQHNIVSDNMTEIESAIVSRPLIATELSSANIEKLARIGVNNLTQLTALNMTEIARRFDIQVVNYVGRLLGQFKHPVAFYHPPAHFNQHLNLLYEIEHTDWLQKPLTRLLEQMECFLKLRDKVAYEIQLTLYQRDKSQQQVSFYSAIGDYSVKTWLQLSKLSLESVRLNAPVLAIDLQVVRMAETPANRSDLFDQHSGEISPLELFSLLQAKLGKEAIQGIETSSDPRPELSTRSIDPFSKPTSTQTPTTLSRPSFIYAQPLPLESKVEIVQGPERIHSGWWDGHSVNRDYFVAREQSGRWLWIYRTPTKEWFIQGLFS
ncbi:nucleotidyltransferase [Vibrio breoganii]|uniref:Y-family DNA polymerase n=1 Tax=Vibrio breoganii TaxID=553239 RepID=UPI000C852AAB|nr:DNA polymerase Y family protein [Vibrio breoganii]PMO60977.1 nucleotidyltransferase [Vibrio breoganii]